MFLFLFFPSYSLLLSSLWLGFVQQSKRKSTYQRYIYNNETREHCFNTVSNSTILSLSFFKFFSTNHRQWTNRKWIFAKAVLPRKRRTTALPPAGSLSGLDSAPLYVTLHDNYPSPLQPSNFSFLVFHISFNISLQRSIFDSNAISQTNRETWCRIFYLISVNYVLYFYRNATY